MNGRNWIKEVLNKIVVQDQSVQLYFSDTSTARKFLPHIVTNGDSVSLTPHQFNRWQGHEAYEKISTIRKLNESVERPKDAKRIADKLAYILDTLTPALLNLSVLLTNEYGYCVLHTLASGGVSSPKISAPH